MPEIQRDETRKAIEALQVPAVVLRIFDGESVHPALKVRAESPFYTFTDGAGLDFGFLPFWECGVMISGYSNHLGEYQQVSLESPHEPSFSSCSFRGLFCHLLICLWEDGHTDSDLTELATLFEMPPIDGLMNHLETRPSCPSDWDQWEASAIQLYESS